ncbi:MAG TPA: ArsA-related P-loop ATPase [Actinomycetes bacterium]|jgi:anion-transporting  ArsA/GET3 family ATPase|nr:ArsA-related P-loop ATPase [Actinomycetes bacterium]
MPLDVLDRARLVVVTGKGGTGKTTVAAALAVAATQRGRRSLMVEVEGRQGLAPLFGRRSLGYQETRLADRLNGLAVDPEAALREYLGRYGFAPLARLLSWARLTTFVTAAAPGLGDILLVGKVWEAATRRRGQRQVYDLVVLDAPPIGRVVPFLRAPETVAELARVGPLRHQADRVKDLLDDPERTAVLLTCVPEELPVTETLEAAVALRAAELPLTAVVVGQVTEDRLGSGAARLPRLAREPSPLAAAAKRADLELSEEALAALLAEAQDRQRQITRERRLLKELRAGLGDLPVVELPLLSGGAASPAAIHALARRLAASDLASVAVTAEGEGRRARAQR